MWDEEDGFFYDVLRFPDGEAQRLKVRSLVGLLPLCATTAIWTDVRERFPRLFAGARGFLERYPEVLAHLTPADGYVGAGRRLLAVLDEGKLRRVLARVLDEREFLSPYGVRSISRHHLEHPFVFAVHGEEYRDALRALRRRVPHRVPDRLRARDDALRRERADAGRPALPRPAVDLLRTSARGVLVKPNALPALLALAGILTIGCGTPVGVKRMNPTDVQRSLTRSVLSSDALSNPTRNALFQHDVVERWEDDPAGTIDALHRAVASGDVRRNDIYALAELSFAHAEATNDQAYDRAAAVYAWLFLFPSEDRAPLDLFDSRTRVAADLYNRGLSRGFALGPDGDFVPREGSYAVPFGHLDVYFDQEELVWGQRRLVKFVPVAELDVEGLATRYRWSGVGAPLAASTEPLDPVKGYHDYVQPWSKVPVTALLRLADVEQQLPTGRVAGRLTLEEPVAQRNVEIEGQEVGLEAETTASLAYMLAESPVWQREIGGFLQRVTAIEKGTQLASLAPYRPGRIPVVFVHGTASSPGRWAQMLNELANDPRIGPRVQAWLFTYDTGNPIGYSSMLLRESLRDLVEKLDPEGKDPALRDMVVIGHSQGGLLAKMTVIDSGDAFWRLASDRPLDDFDLPDEERETVRTIAFVEPVPEVKRVVFLATPHRGSYVAGSWLAHQAARLIVLPANLTRLGADIVMRNQDKLLTRGFGTSVMNMTPGNLAIETLAAMPIVPGVKAHSIIPVKDMDAPRDEVDDGVVEYASAHIDGVESEYVVLSGHSCQDNPHTIREVRRILLEHIAEFDAAQDAAGADAVPPPAKPGDAGSEETAAAADAPPAAR